jgi:hypothetical protein
VSAAVVNNNDIQIGLPCVYEQFCFWSGIAIAVFFVGLIGAIIISVWWDNKKQQKKRQKRRQTNSKNS